ncbi:MAG: Fur family transcriptional regulator [Patescibacteria group bacterium]
MLTHEKTHNCKDELRNVSLKVTPARLAVLDALEQAKTPLDVSGVIAHLRKKGVDADAVTVFRILNMFSKKGLITPIQFNEHKLRYEHADKPPHHHFICEECGSVTDVEGCVVGGIEKKIEKTLGAKVTRHSLEFFGRCRRCIV